MKSYGGLNLPICCFLIFVTFEAYATDELQLPAVVSNVHPIPEEECGYCTCMMSCGLADNHLKAECQSKFISDEDKLLGKECVCKCENMLENIALDSSLSNADDSDESDHINFDDKQSDNLLLLNDLDKRGRQNWFSGYGKRGRQNWFSGYGKRGRQNWFSGYGKRGRQNWFSGYGKRGRQNWFSGYGKRGRQNWFSGYGKRGRQNWFSGYGKRGRQNWFSGYGKRDE